MNPHVLGLSAFYHDSAAAIVRGSEIIAAAQEERFTRKRHDASFPRNAINYCLAEAFVDPPDIPVVAFYDNTALTIDRTVRNFITVAPAGEGAFVKAMSELLGGKLALRPYANVMTNERFHDLFGGPPRQPETRIEIRHMDLAASIQAVTENVMLRLARHARKITGEKNLTMAGGVALNCVANGKVHREKIFEGIWIQPAAGDAGGSLGAALYATHVGLGVERTSGVRDSQKGSNLGPRYSSDEILSTLDRMKAVYERVDTPAQTERVARAIADGMVVGLLKGRMEFGPRALGARSIVADPRRPDMQATMNLKIKYRESFRPFAPAVLHERVAELFDFEGDSPYMLMTAPVRKELRRDFSWDSFRTQGADMLEVINKPRSTIPAVTHVDHSARSQTVHPDDNGDFHRLLTAFHRLTGCPAVINTSFNVRGEPIVNTPEEAYRCFMRTEIDLLVLEDFLLWKKDQPKFEDSDDWRNKFELD